MEKNKQKLGVKTKESASHVIFVPPYSNPTASFPIYSFNPHSRSIFVEYIYASSHFVYFACQQVPKAIVSNVFTLWDTLFRLVGEGIDSNNDG